MAKVRHHAALPFPDLPKFMARLAKVRGVAARGLEFAFLTVGRASEVLGADWRERDLVEKVWIVPGDRMKAGREHRIPLSAPVISVLETMRERWFAIEARRWRGKVAPAEPSVPTGPVFFGLRAGKGLSNMSLLKVLKGLERSDLTTHGFRSTFSDWAARRPTIPNDRDGVSQKIASKVEAALALVEEDLGREASLAVARMLVVYHRRAGGQQHFSLLNLNPDSDRIRMVLAYARTHLEDSLSVERLAQVAN